MYIELFFTCIFSVWLYIQIVCTFVTAFMVKNHELDLLPKPKSRWKTIIVYTFPLLVVKIRKYFNI